MKAPDYATLLGRATAILDRRVGSLWTDRGEHDPGVTQLELLCHQLAEIFFRHALPVSTLVHCPEVDQDRWVPSGVSYPQNGRAVAVKFRSGIWALPPAEVFIGRQNPLPDPVLPKEPLGHYTSLSTMFPACYALAEGQTPSEDTAEYRAAVRQFQGWLLLLDQCLADSLAVLGLLPQLFSATQPQGPEPMVGTVTQFSAWESLTDKEAIYRQNAVNARLSTENYQALCHHLLDFLLALQGMAVPPDMGLRCKQAWLRGLPFLNADREDPNSLAERFELVLLPCCPTSGEDPRSRVVVVRTPSPVTNRVEYRFYLKNEQDKIVWAGGRVYSSHAKAVRMALFALRMSRHRDFYHIAQHGDRVSLRLRDSHAGGVAIWVGDPPDTKADARTILADWIASVHPLFPPWVRLVLCPNHHCFIVASATKVTVEERLACETVMREHCPAHLLPRFFWVETELEDRIEWLYHRADAAEQIEALLVVPDEPLMLEEMTL